MTHDDVVRVVVQYTPRLYALVGLVSLDECRPRVTVKDVTFVRVAATSRWVLYQSPWAGRPDMTTL